MNAGRLYNRICSPLAADIVVCLEKYNLLTSDIDNIVLTRFVQEHYEEILELNAQRLSLLKTLATSSSAY